MILKGDYIKIKIGQSLINKLDTKTVFILENIGMPEKIAPLGGIKFRILEVPYIQDGNLILGDVKGENNTHYLGMDLTMNNIYVEWNYDMAQKVFINTNIESLLLCNYSYYFFIHRLITSEALGVYYDNTSKGGNYDKYAYLLKSIIFDIDEDAAKKGIWSSLIQEMQLGVI